MTKPSIKLKSVIINDRESIAGVIARQTATLVYVVTFDASLESLELTVTVGHQENQVNYTVRSAERILLDRFQDLCHILQERLSDQNTHDLSTSSP